MKLLTRNVNGYFILVAAVARVISAMTHSTWHHPDEWFQTVEFSNYIVNGVISHTQEVDLHMRNLFWPWIASFPLMISKYFFSNDVWVRVFGVQAFSGMLDLIILIVMFHLLNVYGKRAQILAFIFYLFPWFSAADSVRPSQEHIASVFIWISLYLLSARRYFLLGISLMSVGAARYAAFLFSIGIFFSEVFYLSRKSEYQKVRYLLAGVLLGGAGLGLFDAAYYGRPWESLWAYSMYTVVLDLAVQNFGAQSWIEYVKYFYSHWWGVNALLGIFLILFFPVGMWIGYKKQKSWVWALLLYVVGHLCVAHKEPRFVRPLEYLVVYIAILGFFESRYSHWFIQSKMRPWVGAYSFIILLVFLRSLWGDHLRAEQTYFEIGHHLRHQSDLRSPVCAVVTVRKTHSLHLPDSYFSPEVKNPVLAYFPVGKKDSSSSVDFTTKPLVWFEKLPTCLKNETVLMHLYKPDHFWEQAGCVLLPSSVLRYFSSQYWEFLLKKNWVSGNWYQCSSDILARFSKNEVKKVLVRQMKKIEKITGLHGSREEFLKPMQALDDGSLSGYNP